MRCRILILTAGFGEAHDAAARALAASADARNGEGSCRVVDVFAVARPRTNALTRRAHRALSRWAPGAARSACSWLDRSVSLRGRVTLDADDEAALCAVVKRARPDVLCSTHPLYVPLVRAARERGHELPPHFSVVTAAVAADSRWWNAGAEGWFVPNEDTAEQLRGAGVESGRVHVLGFPVSPAFSHSALPLASPGEEGSGRPRVLYLLKSRARHAVESAWRLLSREEWDVTCAVADNAPLEAELRGRAADRALPARVFGWTADIPRLLMTHHVVVTNAGSVTTHEAIAARCPLLALVGDNVIDRPDANAELIRRHGIGAVVSTPDDLIAGLERAFSGDPAVWRNWRDCIARLSRPNAARDIVSALMTGARTSGMGAAAGGAL